MESSESAKRSEPDMGLWPSPADDVTRGPTPVSSRTTRADIRQFIRAVKDGDRTAEDDMILLLSRSRPWLAPLALCIGGFAMLLDGVKLLLTNWRLTLIQLLPAMWIWAAMYDLKAHVIRGKSFHVLHAPVIVIPIVLGIAAITAVSFYLNAVFAFAIVEPGRPAIGPAFTRARSHLPIILGSGAVVGILLGLSTMVVDRWGLWTFAVSLSIVIGIMMVCYVAVPARLIGLKPTQSRRDKLTASAVGGSLGAVVCTPPYVLGRVGLLMLGGSELFVIVGAIFLAIGLTLEAGTTGAVRTVKMSAKLVSARTPTDARTLSGDIPRPADR